MTERGQLRGRTCQGALEGPLLAQVGVPWSPAEFLEKAKSVPHPLDVRGSLPRRLLFPIFAFLTMGPDEVIRLRKERLDYWGRRATELAKRSSSSRGRRTLTCAPS